MPNKIVNLVISVLIIGSFVLSACDFTAQVLTVKVDSTEVKPGETLVVQEMTATVEPTKVIEPIMRFSEAELPFEFVLELEKLAQAIPAWESKTNDELEFEHLVFTRADASYQETSILITVDNLTYILTRSTNKIIAIEKILADTELKPLLIMTKEDGQLAYFTQSVKDNGEIENQILMESEIKDGKSVTVAHLLDGTEVEATEEMGKPESASGRLVAAMVQPDDFKGEISVNPHNGELRTINLQDEVLVWDTQAREWISLAEKNQAFMEALEAKSTEEYGPSLVNAESPVQTYTIEGPDGEPMEIIGQRTGRVIVAVTPELKDMDLFSKYGYFYGNLYTPNKKSGDVLKFMGNEEQAELLKTYGDLLHLQVAKHNQDSVFKKYFEPIKILNEEVWPNVLAEQDKYIDWIQSKQISYTYELNGQVYKNSVDPTKPIIFIEDVPWENVPGANDAEKVENSGAIIMRQYDGMAAKIWVTKKGELVVKLHHLDVEKALPYSYFVIPSMCSLLTGSTVSNTASQCSNLSKVTVSSVITELETFNYVYVLE